MPYSRLRPVYDAKPLLRSLTLTIVLFISACSSSYKGTACNGERQNLEGDALGNVEGLIVDRYNSFSVTMPNFTLESGPLESRDRDQYIPSAVTKESWLAQRISDRKFSIINSPTDQMITFICPAPGQL